MTVKAQTKSAAGSKRLVVVTQTGSSYNRKPGMRETLIGLGLGKVRATRELEDTSAVRGMIEKVRHLVKVEEKGSSK